MVEYLATYYILRQPARMPRKTFGLDALIVNHRFTAMTKEEVAKEAEAKLEALQLEYRDAIKVKHVSTEMAPEYLN